MKKLLKILLTLVFVSSSLPHFLHSGEATSSSSKIKVFLLAGQSNMDGRGDGSKLSVKDHAKLKAAATMDNVSFIPRSKDPSAPNYLPGYGPPVGHYNYEGMKRIGQQVADVYLKQYAED